MILKRGQLVWLDFNPRTGHEQSGRRPAVVISPAEYNALSNCVLVCPITSNTSPWPWKVILPDDGLVRGAILVDQMRAVDTEARHLETIKQVLEPALMDEVIAKLATLTQ